MSSLFKRFTAWLDDEQAPLLAWRYPVNKTVDDASDSIEEIGEIQKVLCLKSDFCSCRKRGCNACKEQIEVYASEIKMSRVDANGVERARAAAIRMAGGCRCNPYDREFPCKLTPACTEPVPAFMARIEINGLRLQTSDEALSSAYGNLRSQMLYQLEVRKKILPPLRALTAEMCSDEHALTHIYALIKTTHGERSEKEFVEYRKSIAWLTNHIQNWFAPGSTAAQAAAARYAETSAVHFASAESQAPVATTTSSKPAAPKKRRKVEE